MSFRKKQFLGFGIIMLFVAAILFLTVFFMNGMRSNLREITEDRYEKVKTAGEIRQGFTQADQVVLQLINSETDADAESKERIEENRNMILQGISYLEDRLNREESRDLLMQIQIEYSSLINTEDDLLRALNGDAPAAEVQSLMESRQEQRDSLSKDLSDFSAFQESLMGAAVEQSRDTYDQMIISIIAGSILCLAAVVAAAFWVIRSTSLSLKKIIGVISRVNYADLSSLPRVEIDTKDEIGEIGLAFNGMAASLEDYSLKEKDYTKHISEQNWLQTNIAEIATMYQDITDIKTLGEKFIAEAAIILDASAGAFYLRTGEGRDMRFLRQASYAGDGKEAGREEFYLGEGLIGQAALDKRTRVLKEIPEDYSLISSGLGEVKPKSILIAPVLFEGNVTAVVEFASIREFTALEEKLLTQLLDTLGITVNSVLGRMEIERLLKESQMMTEELQVQSEELQTQSEELQVQSEELQSQSEELRMINEQLEERTRDAEQKSRDLQQANKDIEEKAEQLLLSSKYKSEFLANMSHELRTPLNSILLLSEMLSEGQGEEIPEEQKEVAKVIHSSGKDLLSLINDILDLSKIEAGKLDMLFEEMNLSELPSYLEYNFSHLAQKKNLDFNISIAEDLPGIMYTDQQRFQQIIKNLLSNSFKFTEKGSVSIEVNLADPEKTKNLPLNAKADFWTEIKVADTGIGIPESKQSIIFEAFQQGDGASVRKYGGTGLGLSICREFAKLLGGWIFVNSEEGKGSTFTLFIPSLPDGLEEERHTAAAQLEIAAAAETEETIPETGSEEPEVPAGVSKEIRHIFKNKSVLICDDDNRNIYALEKALKAEAMEVTTVQNGLECLEMIQQRKDFDIILMDIMMPVMDGYETMQRLRSMDGLQQMPIIALTAKAMKGDKQKCLDAGASDYISKPLKLDQLLSVMRVWLTKASK